MKALSKKRNAEIAKDVRLCLRSAERELAGELIGCGGEGDLTKLNNVGVWKKVGEASILRSILTTEEENQ